MAAVNKYTAECTVSYCDQILGPEEGVLVRKGSRWVVSCPEHSIRWSESHRDAHDSWTISDPLAIFVLEHLEQEEHGTSGFGGRWFHRPAGSGRVVNELGEEECVGFRTAAEHMVTWQPQVAHANINSRGLIVDLYLEAHDGSPRKAGLRLAVQALACQYAADPGFDPAWAITPGPDATFTPYR